LLAQNGLGRRIRSILSDLDVRDTQNLQQRGRQVRHEILAAELPADLREEILVAYEELSAGSELVDVAVRSSATAEDLPDASFAGQQETYLNVQGDAALLETCRRCFASLFTDRAISYREDKGFDHFTVTLSIGVQRMVRSDLASSGVMFSIDTETGFRDVVLINAAYGLGENVVQGSVNPDEYCVFKPTLLDGHRPILQKSCGSKEFKLIYDSGGGKMVKNVPVPPDDRVRFAITDDEILKLARWACQIEEHYSRKRGELTPMDMEREGRSNWRTVHSAGTARDGSVAEGDRHTCRLSPAAKGTLPLPRAGSWREDRVGAGSYRQERRASASGSRGRYPGD
jgi:pyruvate,water dikinase